MAELTNMTMLILSCNKFSDLWDGHVKLLEENWPDRQMETYIVTDAPSDKTYANVEIISAGTECEWSDRLAYAVQHVKTEYVFITLDDYFLIHRVDSDSIVDLLQMMEKKSYDYVRLFPRPKKATRDELEDCKKVYNVDTSCNYSVNLYSGIWRKSFLESTVREPKNAWQFEVSLPKRAREYGAKCAVSNRGEFRILDVVRKGKLLHKPARYFKKHTGIYDGTREVNTWKYEIALMIQTQVARHTPLWLKKRIKVFMRKRGKRFYSDDV